MLFLQRCSARATNPFFAVLSIACGHENMSTTVGTTSTNSSAGPAEAGPSSVGSTSQGPTTGMTTGSADCVETRTLLALSESTPFGMSSGELLDEKLGPRATTLSFGGGFIDPISEMWSGAKLPLTVEIKYEGGVIYWIDAEGEPNEENQCIDRVEIELRLDFATDAGEFDEHRTALAVLIEPQTLQISTDFVPPGLMGSLDLDTVFSDPDWVIESMWLVGTWRGKEAGGRVMRAAVVSDTTNTAYLARWGTEGLQDLPDEP